MPKLDKKVEGQMNLLEPQYDHSECQIHSIPGCAIKIDTRGDKKQ